MARIARKDLSTPFLHIMIQGINHEYIFEKEEYMKMYLKLFNKYKNDYDFTLIAYCIMHNHVHFLMYAENVMEISKIMHKVNLLYTINYNTKLNREGVLFRNRYKVEPIYNEKYLLNCIKYIHNNPVVAKIVKKCSDYKYSSYNDYEKNIGIAKNKILEKIFGKDCNYLFLINSTYDKIFIDVERNIDVEYYILERN